ncbi:DUF1028 domain-containing protein [Halobacillus fulvus]|nr:DUF1028 domain-containing protein [Halobacillus fulvus]
MNKRTNIVATFSIVASDPKTGELGVAVQSKFLGVGSVVPWAEAGVGAVATQALANPTYGPEGLRLLRAGHSVNETVHMLTEKDAQSSERQVGVVDASGNAATFTGDQCYEWAGGVTGKHYAAQGNILVNKETVTEMGKTFESAKGPLADRLLSALHAAQEAGGDSRGKQSAALYVVKKDAGYAGLSDVLVDLRVDDHPDPIVELDRIYQLHQLYFGETKPEDVMEITIEEKEYMKKALRQLGYVEGIDSSDDELFDALQTYINTENFEARAQKRGWIDRKVYHFLQNQV